MVPGHRWVDPANLTLIEASGPCSYSVVSN